MSTSYKVTKSSDNYLIEDKTSGLVLSKEKLSSYSSKKEFEDKFISSRGSDTSTCLNLAVKGFKASKKAKPDEFIISDGVFLVADSVVYTSEKLSKLREIGLFSSALKSITKNTKLYLKNRMFTVNKPVGNSTTSTFMAIVSKSNDKMFILSGDDLIGYFALDSSGHVKSIENNRGLPDSMKYMDMVFDRLKLRTTGI